MAELSVRERLQPSLLDRLTDDEPGKKVESRQQRAISIERLRQCVLRDLGWLLNTGNLGQSEDISSYPEVTKSVVNYGTPDLAGRVISSAHVTDLTRSVRQAILDFEPRILRDSVQVNVAVNESTMSSNTLTFEIEGVLWAQPTPLQLFLKTEIDLETGHAKVLEQ
jgi:type VI secretion system protein ImpF